MTSKDQIREQFGANAAAYVDSVVHAKGASLSRLGLLIDPGETWRTLDVATGTGHTAFLFAPHVAQVIASDITPEMLQKAQELARERGLKNVRFETADAEDLPYSDDQFDLVTCRIAAHHFENPSLFVAESQRVLRPGGLLAVVDNIVPPGPVGDYVNAFEKLRDPSHGRCLSLEQWLELFNAANLTVTHQETLAKRLGFDFWAQRHGAVMQSYLQAMLSEAGSAAMAFLDPQAETGGLTFRLLEGIIIGRKEG